jgi:phosphoribosylaminoimidazolecarboxamide formyltransferase / IMP cyclohydrolase
MQKERHALISVANKDGLPDFARALNLFGFTLWGSRGTVGALSKENIPAHDVSELVGGDPILGHRVVTLSREIHAGLLARKTVPEDMAQLEKLGIPCFDIVCVDFYPLGKEIAREGSTKESVIEQTDIGGPTMIRSAVKGERIVICDAIDRQSVIDWLLAGEPDNGLREHLAAKGEFVVAEYVMTSALYRLRMLHGAQRK